MMLLITCPLSTCGDHASDPLHRGLEGDSVERSEGFAPQASTTPSSATPSAH